MGVSFTMSLVVGVEIDPDKIIKKVTVTHANCPKCGADTEGANFCSNCGREVRSSVEYHIREDSPLLTYAIGGAYNSRESALGDACLDQEFIWTDKEVAYFGIGKGMDVSYGRKGVVGFNDFEDVVRKVRNKAREFGLDPDSVGVYMIRNIS